MANLAPRAVVGARTTICTHIDVVSGVVVQIGERVRMDGDRLGRHSGDAHAGRHDSQFPVGFAAAGYPVDVCGGGGDVAGRNTRGFGAERSNVNHNVVDVTFVIVRGRLRSLDGDIGASAGV